MISLIQILKESISEQELKAVRDWVVDDYNPEFGYNPNTDIESLINVLKPYIYKGKIYRLVSIPKDVTDIKDYIWKKGKDRYSSFADDLSGIKYFLPFIEDEDEKAIIISQVSYYYSISQWYNSNINDLEELYNTDPEKYWWIDQSLPEVENTGEAIAKLDPDFEIYKVL